MSNNTKNSSAAQPDLQTDPAPPAPTGTPTPAHATLKRTAQHLTPPEQPATKGSRTHIGSSFSLSTDRPILLQNPFLGTAHSATTSSAMIPVPTVTPTPDPEADRLLALRRKFHRNETALIQLNHHRILTKMSTEQSNAQRLENIS